MFSHCSFHCRSVVTTAVLLALCTSGQPALLNCPHNPARSQVGSELFWQQVYGEVAQAVASVQGRDFATAKLRLAEALHAATDGLASEPQRGFECSLGVGAICHALALAYCLDESLTAAAKRRAHQIGLRFMHLANVWITHVWEKYARREEGTKAWYDQAYIDESVWPTSLLSINQDLTVVQHVVSDSGAPGHRPRWPDVPHTFRNPRLSVGITSLCAYPDGHVLPAYATSNHQLYAERHGYRYRVSREKLDATRPPAWGKIKLMYSCISEEPDVQWWLWFDCDTFFMNMSITLDSLLYKYGARAPPSRIDAADVELDPDFNMLVAEDNAMLNTGVFFLRRSQWSLQYLERVWGPYDSVWAHHPWWENAAFLWNLLKDNARKFASEDHRAFLAGTSRGDLDDMESIYPREVRLAPQWEFNSYHPITAQDQHDAWRPGKFALAFNGVMSGVADSLVVMRALYGNYYEQSCELNRVRDKCKAVEETLPWLPARTPM